MQITALQRERKPLILTTTPFKTF
jgi:hypothetical protein